MSSNATILTTVAGVSACSLLLITLFRKRESQQDITKTTDIDCITPEDVVKVFDTLFLHMQSACAKLSAEIQKIQMSGQMIPEPQLRQILRGEFERGLLTIQSKVFEENNVDECCLEEATWEFMKEGDKYPAVKKAVERFQKLYENVSGESIVGIIPGSEGDLTVAKVLTDTPEDEILSKEKLGVAAKVYFDALTEAMRTIVKKHAAQGTNLADPALAHQLQMQFAMVANDAGEEALMKEGVSLDSFRKSIDAHKDCPETARNLMFLQMKQQQDLMAMGVPSMG